MYGQMTAGSWIYIGTQGILQGTYETFAAVARKRFGGTLAGRLVVTAGLGGMGGAQPLAVTMNDGVRAVRRGRPAAHRAAHRDRLPRRARRRPRRRAAPRCEARQAERRARCRSACSATPPRCCPSSCAAASTVDVVTDQTSAHDPLNGYVPAGLTRRAGRRAARAATPTTTCAASASRCRRARRRDPRAAGGAAPRRSTTATPCAGWPPRTATRTPSPTPASSPPTSARCSARARARSAGWRCRATRPTSTPPTRRSSTCSATRSTSRAGSRLARERVALPGPAGAHLLAGLRRAPPRRACASTRWSPAASCAAPIVIGRDHLDAGSVASPQRETESMRDGSDAVADWPLLNALVNTAVRRARGCPSTTAAASGWASRSTPARSCVADGTPEAARAHPPRADRRPGHGHRAPRRRRRARRRSRPPQRSGRADADARPGVSVGRRSAARARSCARRTTACPTCATTAPASCALEPGAADPRRRAGSPAFEDDRRRRRAHRRDAAARCCPGFVDCHTHLPFAGWRAEEYELKVTGVPVRGDRARAAAGSRRRARALAEASDDEVLAQARGARAPRCSRTGTTTFECKTGYGLSVDGELRAPLRRGPRARRAADRVDRRCSPTPCPRATTPTAWMDEVDALRRGAADVDALDIYVESVAFANEHLARLGAHRRARTGVPLRAHVEQFNANRSVPVALAAGARSVDHLACLHPDDVAPLAARRVRRRAAARRRVPRRRARRPGARARRRRARSACSATDLNPGTSPVVVAAGDHRARPCAATAGRVREALLAVHAERGLGARPVRASSARSRSASAPTSSLLDAPVEHVALPLRAQPGVPWSSAPASSPTCARTPRGGSSA